MPENRRDKILIGETSPRGNENVVHPLTFLRGITCLNAKYKKTRSCARLDADGYAHHAYTTRIGPRFEPSDKDDVTIGVLDRLVTALDKAGRARGLPRGLKIYLTEFGIQSEPDRISGVSFARQPAYYAIAEHMAYVNPRVALFSQYLMRDDAPREEGYRFRGFESGLRRNNGQRKPAYRAFPNPLAVERYGPSDVLWGLIRPQPGVTRVTIEVRRPGNRQAGASCAGSTPPRAASSACARSIATSRSTACAGPRATARATPGRRSARTSWGPDPVARRPLAGR